MSTLANPTEEAPKSAAATGDAFAWAEAIAAVPGVAVANIYALRDALAPMINELTEGHTKFLVETGIVPQEVVYAPPPGLVELLIGLHNSALGIAGRTAAVVKAIAPELVDEERQAHDEPELPLATGDGVVGE